MDFEEFCWALGDETTVPFIKQMFDNKKEVGQAINRKINTLFRQYIIVGGMPKAVLTYSQTKTQEWKLIFLFQKKLSQTNTIFHQ